jgi:hypothetical protein
MPTVAIRMKLTIDFRKPRVWVSTFILAAILAFAIRAEFLDYDDRNFLFIHIILSIVSLVAFMMNAWLPLIIPPVILPFIYDLFLTPNRMFLSGDFKIAVAHLDYSIYLLTIFSINVITYLHRVTGKMLSEESWKTLGYLIMIFGMAFLPTIIQVLLVLIAGIQLRPPIYYF